MSRNTDWQVAALNDLRTTSMTMSEIARRYGRSERTIEKLKYQHEVVRTLPTRRGPQKRDELTPISREHATIGIKLSLARKGKSPSEFAREIGLSVPTLVGMEHGHVDFKLSQLMRISEYTGLALSDLIQSFDKNIYHRSPNARQ